MAPSLRADSPENCRQRRRRRIEMRRMRSGSSSQVQQLSPETKNLESVNNDNEKGSMLSETPITVVPLADLFIRSSIKNPMPVFGTMSIQGLSENMEDAWFVMEDLCRPNITGGQPLHFFAVYDGHGGSHVSSLCKRIMHQIILEELMGLQCTRRQVWSSSQENQQELGEREWKNLVGLSLQRSFWRVDQTVMSRWVSGDCGFGPMQSALAGSTAVVAILTPKHIVVANCGDSRAVLCRNGKTIPLSLDHKPNRGDEQRRIFAAGGHLVHQNGILRVEGVLNITRSIGDSLLKPIIISQPEVCITRRDHEDECLIVASDGLWDVISNDVACEVARTCLRNESVGATPGSNFFGDPVTSTSDLAAAMLCRLALGRRTSDNVTVIVVDLKS